MSLLNSLAKLTQRSAKRIGRGYGSGVGGHTVGRGQKGQNSRRGHVTPVWFEGGQLPLIKRLPMQRGKGRFNVVRPTAEITLTDIEKLAVTVVTLETLKLHKVIEARFKKAKIIASGELTKKIQVQGVPVSKGARKIIEALGGTVE